MMGAKRIAPLVGSLGMGLGCATIQPVHGPPTPAEIREINAEAPVYVTPLPAPVSDQVAWNIDHIVAADAEKIVVAPDGGAPIALWPGYVGQFHVRRRARAAAIGAGIGAPIGALDGLYAALLLTSMGDRSVNDPPDNSGFPVGPALALAAGGAVIGAAVGAVIGALVGSTDNFPVVLGPAPPSLYEAPTPAASLAPAVAKSAARVVAPSADVRRAPFKVAPAIVTLARGQRLQVAPTPNAGWRVAFLSDGRVGYVQDAEVEVDSP